MIMLFFCEDALILTVIIDYAGQDMLSCIVYFLCYSMISFVLNYLRTVECLTGMDIRVPQAEKTCQHRKV